MPGDGKAETADRRTTLRAAIQEANANPGADTINIPSGMACTLQIALDPIRDDLTINGNGGVVQRSATTPENFPIFQINSGTVTISLLSITGGNRCGVVNNSNL